MFLAKRLIKNSFNKKIFKKCRNFSIKVPEHVNTLIVGGGIIGTSTGLHMATQEGSVLVLEQNTLTSGTTWHAAGLVGSLKGSGVITEMSMKSREIYKNLENVGWHNTGSLALIRSDDSFHQHYHSKIVAEYLGNKVNILSPNEIAEVHPFLNLDGIQCGFHMPDDGIVNPADVTIAMSKKAKQNGVKFQENCEVLEIHLEDKKVVGVTTNLGYIGCDRLLISCGMWTPKIAAMAGEVVPQACVPHQYICFEAMNGVTNKLPVIRDLLGRIYVKPEVGGFMVGVFEDKSHNHLPADVRKRNKEQTLENNDSFELFQEDLDKSGEGLEAAINLITGLENVGIKQFLHGPDAHAVDHGAIMGRFPNKENLYVASAFNSQGITCGYAAGLAMSEWMTYGYPQSFTSDFWSCDIRRFDPAFAKPEYAEERACEGYDKFYCAHYPKEPWKSQRNFKVLPAHDIHLKNGGMMTEAFGIERPLWFSNESDERSQKWDLSYDQKDTSWWNQTKQDCIRCRNDSVVFDMSTFAKIEVEGEGALEFLQYLCTADINRPVGSITYSLMTNEHGGCLADLTVYRTDENKFYLIIPTAVRYSILGHVNMGAEGKGLRVTDTTDDFGVYALMGPNSRQVLSKLTSEKLDNENFPFGTGKNIQIGDKTVLALRVSFVGELGWELHFPVEHASILNDLLEEGTHNAGLIALLDSLRVEKQFVHFGHDITPTDTALEVGLGFACKFKTDIDFLGRKALEKQKENGVKSKLASFIVDDENVSLWGHELIFRNGVMCGYVTTGAYSHTLDKPIALGIVKNPDKKVTKKWLENGNWTIGIPCAETKSDKQTPAKISLQPVVDPKGKRVLGVYDSKEN